MTDEIKTDYEKASADVKADIAAVGSAETKASGWVKTHHVWLIALGAFILGALVGHFAK